MNRTTRTETIRTVDLGHEQLLILDNQPGARLRVLSGGAWLTEEGRLDDVHARPGETVTLSASGRAVLEGVGPARVEVMLPQPAAWPARLAQAVGAWRLRDVSLALRAGAVVLSLALGVGLADLVARGLQHASAAQTAVHVA